MSYTTMGAAIAALLHGGCFFAFLSGAAHRRVALRVLALFWALAMLPTVPLATASIARATSSGVVLGAVVGAVLIVFWALLVEGLWNGRGWVMYAMGLLGVLMLVGGYNLLAAGQAGLGAFRLLSGLFLAGISLQHLREVTDPEPMELAEPAAEKAAPVEPAV